MKTNRLLTTAVCLLALTPALAHGQDKAKDKKKKPKTEEPAPPPAPVKKTLAESLEGPAKADYDTGVALYKQGSFAPASAKFQSAYETSKDARLLWNAAAAEKQQRHYAKSRTFVRQYVTLAADLTDKDKQDANDLLAVLDKLVSEVTINVNQPGAAIFVDGEQIGESPMPKPATLDTGTRSFRVTKEGFLPYEAQVPIAAEPTGVVNVALAPHIKDGRIAVRASQADAVISIDHKLLAKGSYSGVVPSGSHQLSVTKDGYKPYELSFTIAENGTRSFDVTLEKNKRKVPVWAIVAGSVLVAGIATAVIVIAAQPDDSAKIADGTFPPYRVVLNSN